MNQRSRPSASRGLGVCRAMALALGALFGLCACQSTSDTSPYKTLGWEKHRLPNTAEPYAKLLVEIDAVDGTEPNARELADLKTLLEQLTRKPGGVTVKVDNLITRAKARGRSPDSLALEYLDGPSEEQTAFIYILCYRGRLSPLPANAENPYFTHYPYPAAIFINRSYAFGWFSWYGRARQLMMQHEVGHALGLADNENHSQSGHCTNKGCLMSPGLRFDVGRFLTFRPPFTTTEFCSDCRRDLENYKQAEAPAGMRFWRGYFVRSGEGYHILTLPGMVYVHLGEFEQVDFDRLAARRRETMLGLAERGDRQYHAHGDLPQAAEGLRHFVERETETEGLRAIAEKILAECLSQAEAMRDSDPEEARAVAGAALAAAELKFPELHAKLQTLHDSLAANAGDKTTGNAAGK